MIAIVIVIEVILAAGIIVLEKSNTDVSRHDVSVIARVNTDGSGIYIDEKYEVSDFITIDEEGNYVLHKGAWGGKVFGTPGSSTIQHLQLMDLVVNVMGLKFVNYDGHSEKKSDTVYFSDKITNYDAAIQSDVIDGGILWEPQYHKIVESDKFKEMVTTNVLFPGHTCCVIAGYQSFLDNNKDDVVRFLAAYIEAVDYINNAKNNVGGEEYKKLVEICMNSIKGVDEKVVMESLDTIIFKYSDEDGTSKLTDLESDIALLTQSLTNLGSIKVSMKQLGFYSYEQFAKTFVNDSFLEEAVKGNATVGSNKKIIVSAIDGDMHQIALQVAKELGIFAKYGLDVEIRPLQNGGSVALDLLSGQSDIGFAGAPPMTTNTVNGKHIMVVE